LIVIGVINVNLLQGYFIAIHVRVFFMVHCIYFMLITIVLNVSIFLQGVYLNEAKIISTDLPALNGFIYVIDKVLT